LSTLFFTFGIIAGSLAIGYLIQQLVRGDRLKLPFTLDTLRKILQKTALLGVLPVTVLGAIWIVDIRSAAIAALPFIGLSAILLGGLLALLYARLMRLEPRKTGALFPCGSFTNIGSIGALVCFIFLGEQGFALVPIYKVFEELSYYAIGFPIAKYFSTADQVKDSTRTRLRALARDPFILVALISITCGAALNFSGIPRPLWFRSINALFIPLGTSLLLASIGLAMRFKSVRFYLRECTAVAIIKFVLVPTIATTIAVLLGYGELQSGLPLKVVMILSSMPVAFNALIPPSIYDLDLDLANACWFFTTSSLIITLPMLSFMLRWV